MKRLATLFLALLMVLSLTTFAHAEVPVEVVFWHSWGSGPNLEAVEELTNAFNAEHEGKIHVSAQYIGGYSDTLSKCIVGYSGGDNPTVSVVDACMTLNAVEYGIMEDLSAYIQANDPEYDVGQFFPGMMIFSTDIDGHVWSLPFARSTQVMYVNQDLIAQCMGEAFIPQTWDDIWKICEAWKAQTGEPAYSHGDDSGWFSFYVTTIGFGEYYNKAGTGACLYMNDAWEKALTAWRNAIELGWYSAPSLSTAGPTDQFIAGKLPIIFASTGALTRVLAGAKDVFNVGVGYLPGGLKEDGSIYRCVQTGGANLYLANNKSDEEKAAGWEFLKYMTSYDANIYHALKTGYLINHVGAEQNEEVLAKWAESPEFRVSYDQLQFVHETYVSKYCSELDLEETDVITAFVMDNVSVADTLAAFDNVYSSIFPDGVVDTYE